MKGLKDAWFIGSRDLAYMLRQKETILWTFFMPLVFFYFIGTVTAGFGGKGSSKDVVALRVGENAGFLADEIQLRLEEQDFVVRRPDGDAEAKYSFEQYTRQIELPASLTSNVQAGRESTVSFRRRGAGLSTELESLRVKRAVYTVLADLLSVRVSQEEGASVAQPDFAKLREMPRALRLDISSAGERLVPPSGFEQTVPGTMVMFTMLVLLTSGAASLVVERRLGVLRRLASAPLSRASIVAGKWAAKLSLGLVQVSFAMLVGTLAFGVAWGENLPMVMLVMLAYAALLASLGLLLGSLARTEGQAVGIGVLSANVLAALGGCWWPIEITPDAMQSLALLTPTGWTMHALHQLVNFGAEASVAIPHVVGMSLTALLLGWAVTRAFRFE